MVGESLPASYPFWKERNITLIGDIRRIPKSPVTEYSKENLEQLLPKAGVIYVFLGELLAGFRKSGYPQYMQTDAYQQGIRKLLELVEKENLILMCKERSDAGCHRRYIVSTLNNMNKNVIPIP